MVLVKKDATKSKITERFFLQSLVQVLLREKLDFARNGGCAKFKPTRKLYEVRYLLSSPCLLGDKY